MDIFDILGKEIDRNVVDVDQLMVDVEQLQDETDRSIPVPTLKPVSTFITGNKSNPVHKPSWGGYLRVNLNSDPDEDDSQKYKCGR